MTDAPVPRCCPEHTDWVTLNTHLAAEFPAVADEDVAAHLRQARQAAQLFHLAERDQFETAELLVRYQLRQLTGLSPANARIDPEVHARRRRDAASPG